MVALLAAIALAASSVGIGSGPGIVPSHSTVWVPPDFDTPALLFTASKTGTLPCDDPNTVACVTWRPDGGGLVDSKGNAWTMNGTVPQATGATSSPLYPNGYAASPMAGAGPYNASNYYSLAGSTLQTTGDFWVCVGTSGSDATTDQIAISNTDGTSGWYLNIRGVGGIPAAGGLSGGTQTLTLQSASAATVAGPNITCFGRSGSTSTIKTNLAAAATSTTAFSNPPAASGRIGLYYNGTLPFKNTIMFVAVGVGEAGNDALFTSIESKFYGLVPDVGPTLSESRGSVATGVIAGKRWTYAAGVPRIGPFDGGSGLYVEGASTNNLLNSSTPATQTTASLATGSYTGWVEGSGSLAFTAGTATATGLPCTATAASDCHITITGAGTVVATVTGTLTAEQLEPMPARTSYIATAGTVASRLGDAITATIPPPTIASSSYSASVTAQLEMLDTGTAEALLGSNQNYAPLLEATVAGNNTTVAACSDSVCTASTLTYSGQLSSTKYTLKKVGTSLTAYVAGSPGSTVTTSTQPTNPTTLRIGSHNDGRPMFGAVSRVCLSQSATGCAP